jgi:hypothetical protein
MGNNDLTFVPRYSSGYIDHFVDDIERVVLISAKADSPSALPQLQLISSCYRESVNVFLDVLILVENAKMMTECLTLIKELGDSDHQSGILISLSRH